MRLVGPPATAGTEIAGRADALAAIGYCEVSAGDVPEGRRRQHLLHRHVAVVVSGRMDQRARGWLRELALTSDRAHLVIGRPPIRGRHETAAGTAAPPSAVPMSTQHGRARRASTGGRAAEARRWWRAACGAARRRGGLANELAILREYAAWSARRGSGSDVRWIGRQAAGLLSRIDPTDQWVTAAVLSAQALVIDGALAPAEALLAAAAVEGLLETGVVPEPVALARADVAQGEGRWQAAHRWRDGTAGRHTRHGPGRWRKQAMTVSVWSGVPVLLDDLNHAIDPVAGLRRACEWARTQAGGGRVAVVEDGSGRVVAAAPDDARVYRDDLRVPIRLSGELIGWVVAGRAGCDAHSLEGCAQVLAAACGPAVRAVRAGAEVETVARGLAGELLGTSAAMTALRAAIVKVAATGFPVVIEGESGVGKELVARAIHRLSPRGRQRLAAINCAALTDELFDAELFGHARGAFTGAVGARPGLFEDADRGTIFLDEVADLTPRAQAKLLRVLQEREVRRVGENTARAVDVRVVAATNRSLRPAVERGDFRQDLHFRLAVVRLEVPPLRERPEDVPVLAAAAWHRLTRDRSIRSWLSPQAIAALCRHRWPGNVRELHNVMAGLVVAAPAQGAVSAGHVAAVIEGQGGAAPASAVSLESARRALDQTMVRGALARHAGCRAAAARDLGLSRQGLAKLMVRLAIDTAPVANDPPFR